MESAPDTELPHAEMSHLSDPNPVQDKDVLLVGGFTEQEAAFASRLLEHAGLASAPTSTISDAQTWLDTMLPPAWICRLLANHVTDAEHGVRIYERATDNPGLTRRLDFRADALDSNCRDLIIGPNAFRYRMQRNIDSM